MFGELLVNWIISHLPLEVWIDVECYALELKNSAFNDVFMLTSSL